MICLFSNNLSLIIDYYKNVKYCRARIFILTMKNGVREKRKVLLLNINIWKIET